MLKIYDLVLSSFVTGSSGIQLHQNALLRMQPLQKCYVNNTTVASSVTLFDKSCTNTNHNHNNNNNNNKGNGCFLFLNQIIFQILVK